MNEDIFAEVRTEGSPAFPVEETKEVAPAESQPAKTDEAPVVTPEAPKPEEKAPLPFHEDPKVQDYITRQLDVRLEAERVKIREEFSHARKENAETDIPDWFGGTPEQWEQYQAHQDGLLKSAEERAIKRISDEAKKESELVKAATDHFNTELTAIESDKDLNPTGAKIDPNKLLKCAMDNDLVDSKGRWNYRAAFKVLSAQTTAPAETVDDTKDRKELAGATTSEKKPETKAPAYKTQDDFKTKRPW